MVVVGGIGTVVGPLLGAFVLTFLPEWLRVSNAYYQLIYGAGLALMIVFLPVGLWGLVRARLRRAAPALLVEPPPLAEPQPRQVPAMASGALLVLVVFVFLVSLS
jgi:branched-chain amino acid transport system permease protein